MGTVKIFNNNLNAYNWQNRDKCGFVVNGHTDIWRINISANLGRVKFLKPLLTEKELLKAGRFFQLKDTNGYIIGRAAIRNILGRYLNLAPTEVEFAIGNNDKPYINNPSALNINYNLSHSGDWIMLAVAATPVGIDVEFIKPTFDYETIITEFFAADEIAYIQETSSLARFYKVWTRKEAITKGTGKGMDEDMPLISGLDGEHEVDSLMIRSANNWLVNTFAVNHDHTASVAVNRNAASLRFFEFTF